MQPLSCGSTQCEGSKVLQLQFGEAFMMATNRVCTEARLQRGVESVVMDLD